MSFLILSRSVGLKKKLKKKEKLWEIGGLVPQHNCCGAWKQQDTNPNMVEKVVVVIVKLSQQGKMNQPPKFLCDIKMV